ncbi:MAG: NADH-quinone oxidoreductase subunit C, partial [Desulforhabdus sp.]|nr:NADH-quinone oxidoreductase subunit C [Desulforhabdus sp.]
MPTFQVDDRRLKDVLFFLKNQSKPKFLRLEDVTAIDESVRRDRRPDRDLPNSGAVAGPDGQKIDVGDPHAPPDFTLVYHLLSFDNASRIRLKVPLTGARPHAPSVTGIWPSANWYEREVYDMFGIRFEGHPSL